MIPEEAIAQQLALVTHVDILVAQQIVKNWQSLSPESRLSVALIPDLIGLVTEIATAYAEANAIAAADFYDYMADLSGRRLPAAVAASPVPVAEQVEKMMRWATGPLRFETPLPDVALQRVVGAATRLAQQPGRMTMFNMARRDATGYARVPQGGTTCPFCLMLCSRGAVYWSRDSAGEPDAHKFHTRCDCAIVPIMHDSDVPPINRELEAQWQEMGRQGGHTLEAWRQYLKDGTVPERATVTAARRAKRMGVKPGSPAAKVTEKAIVDERVTARMQWLEQRLAVASDARTADYLNSELTRLKSL